MKKIFKLLYITIVTIICGTLLVKAESDTGLWKIHAVFNENKTRAVDTGDKVYCVTDGSINVFDKSTKQFESLTKLNRLSDFYVNNIYYNKDKKYMVVTYTNFNIDILLDDGTTINIPNLKNYSSTEDCTINDVTFGDNAIYVASKIGYLVIEDKKFTVKKAAVLGSSVQSIAEMGDKLLLATGSNILYTDIDTDVKSLNQLVSSGLNISGTITPVDDIHFFVKSSLLYLVTFSNEVFNKTSVSKYKPVYIQPSANGFIAWDTSKFYEFNDEGVNTVNITLPADIKGTLLTTQEKDGSLWSLSSTGLKQFVIDMSSSTVVSASELYVPSGVTAKRVGELAYNDSNKRMYVTSGGPGIEALIEMYGKQGYICSYDGNSWRNEMPTDMKGYKLQDPYKPVFDRIDTDAFYVGTWYQGMFKIKNNEIVAKYDWTNSPMLHALNNWFCQVPCYEFDKYNNLWVLQHTAGDYEKEIYVLPSENVDKDSVKTNDWKVFEMPTAFLKRLSFCIDENDYKIVYDGNYDGLFRVFSNDSSLENVRYKDFYHFYDQDGKKINWSMVSAFEEDKNGIVWIAYSYGIVGIKLEEAFNDDFRVIRPLKNGNQYEYILDNIFCTCISVDDYNRKWIGTIDGEVYLLNEDCTEVLKQFNASNCNFFPNNRILSICWNSNTQSVFIGFNGGLLEYTPENYTDISSISVTPSRVTPYFKGLVLFDKVPVDSTLFIKDKKGNTVKTINTEDSRIYWDCTDDNGNHIETGKYTVSIKLKGEENIQDNISVIKVIK